MNDRQPFSRIRSLLFTAVALVGVLLVGWTMVVQFPTQTLYVLGALLVGCLALRGILLFMLGGTPQPEYRRPDYQHAESTLMGKFPGAPRSSRTSHSRSDT